MSCAAGPLNVQILRCLVYGNEECSASSFDAISEPDALSLLQASYMSDDLKAAAQACMPHAQVSFRHLSLGKLPVCSNAGHNLAHEALHQLLCGLPVRRRIASFCHAVEVVFVLLALHNLRFDAPPVQKGPDEGRGGGQTSG